MEDKNNKLKIGKTIRKVRELKNLTQEYVAHKLNMSISGYSRIERDEVAIGLERALELCKLFEMNIEHFISFDDKNIFNNSNFSSQENNQDSQTVKMDNDELYKSQNKQIENLENQIDYLRNLVNNLTNNNSDSSNI